MKQLAQSMSQLPQSSQLSQDKNSFLLETFSDQVIESILSELIDFVLVEYPDRLHCGILSAYLIPAKNYVAVLNNRQSFRLETDYLNFINVEETNG